jgi:hypothetical protein
LNRRSVSITYTVEKLGTPFVILKTLISETKSEIQNVERMLKMKQSIIYILIFAIITGSIGPERIAFAAENQTVVEEEPPAPLTKVVVTDPLSITQAIRAYSADDQSFGMSKDSKNDLNKSLSSGSDPEERSTTWITIQSMITSFVMLGIAVLHKKAHEENLNLAPANVKALADSVGGLVPALINVVASVPGGYGAYKVNKGALNFFAKYLPFLQNKWLLVLFKSLVSGGLLSIGTDYVRGYVIFSAQEVIDHPDIFGGVNTQERATLKYLQTQAGFGYFLGSLAYMSGIHYGGKLIPDDMPVLSPEKKAQYEAFFNIDAKVFKAMRIILEFWDNNLLSVLSSHLWRQAMLQGRNAQIIFFSFVSNTISELLADESATVTKFDKQGFIISVVVGIIASFTPTRWKDIGTSKANTNWANEVQKRYENVKLNYEIRNFNYNQSEDGLVKDLNSIFDDERESRENRLVKFAYLMMLSINRTANLQNEKLHIMARQLQKSQGTLPKIQGAEEWTVYIYRQIFGAEILSDNASIRWDDSDINYYKSLFQSSITNMMQIYIDEESSFKKLAQLDWPPKAREIMNGQLKNFQQMEVFINILNQTLIQQWSSATPDATFDDTQNMLEQISFWGISEDDVLRRIINGSIVNH